MSLPYPFHLAYPLEGNVEDVGNVHEWHVEWKWEGLRAQIVKREGEVWIWAKDKTLITDKLPELQEFGRAFPDGTVIDGTIVPWRKNVPVNVAELQRRIRRKRVSKALLQEIPVRFMAFDLLEYDRQDIREKAFSWRKEQLAALISEVSHSLLQLSPEVLASDWSTFAEMRENARKIGAGGLMIKRLDSPYHAGRKRGDWWKWNADPFRVNAVLLYAQRGQGQHAHLYTEYTFGVWDGERLVSFARTGSGLTEAEIQEVDRFVRQNTMERFGPVRSVQPELVFEIAFEGIQASTRHKSGVTVRSPRISRWQRDKKKEEADTLGILRGLIK
jgi:DNA ligase-1